MDLLVVGGSFRPSTLRALCDPERGVDLVLLAGFAGYEEIEGGPVGFMGETAVALDACAGSATSSSPEVSSLSEPAGTRAT